MESKEYAAYVAAHTQKTCEWRTLPIAFLVGGIICMIGQGVHDLYAWLLPDLEQEYIASITGMTMIALGALFTGFGVYDRLGAIAGAGSIVPITGFANSVASPAMEFRSEGIVHGTMAKMFVVAGPIIVSGICASVLVGLIYRLVVVFS